MKKYQFTVLIEQDEDGVYVAKVPQLRGCHTQGKTVEQVLERIREAIDLCLEVEKGSLVPTRFILSEYPAALQRGCTALNNLF